MRATFLHHLRQNWPLAVLTAGLLIYLGVVLAAGTFYTNQGPILRSQDPLAYWRWVLRFAVLALSGSAVLLGSHFLGRN